MAVAMAWRRHCFPAGLVVTLRWIFAGWAEAPVSQPQQEMRQLVVGSRYSGIAGGCGRTVAVSDVFQLVTAVRFSQNSS